MSLLLSELGSYAASAGQGTLGEDIFLERMPANPDNLLTFYSIGSPAPDNYLDTQYLHFEVWVRDSSTKTAGDKLDAIFNLFHRAHHLTLGDYYVYLVQALDNITNMDQDTEGRKLFKLTLEAIYRDNRTVS